MRRVFFISDRTGITTESLGGALLTQFTGLEFKREVLPFIDTINKAEQAIYKIKNCYYQDQTRPIVLTSIIDSTIRNKFNLDFVFHIDFFEAFIASLEQELGVKAHLVVGKSHGISDETKYHHRIEAIHYSLENDDGISVKNFAAADVILVGVSRVGKTPTCVFLAVNFGIKAANYPFAEADLENDSLPLLLIPHQRKIFGLTIEALKLHEIRTHRIPNSNYASLKNCIYEVRVAEKLMHIAKIPFLNTSTKSIEEISVAIMQQVKLHKQF